MWNVNWGSVVLLLISYDLWSISICVTGISYLSRAQESVAKIRLGTSSPSLGVMKSSSPPTVADTVFIERIRSRIKHWRNTCKNSGTKTSKDGKKIFSKFCTMRFFLGSPFILYHSFCADELINSIRNIISGSEQFKSRPCLNVDVCSDRQVQLILQVLNIVVTSLIWLIQLWVLFG